MKLRLRLSDLITRRTGMSEKLPGDNGELLIRAQ
jgi:hypothetical protein